MEFTQTGRHPPNTARQADGRHHQFEREYDTERLQIIDNRAVGR